MALEGKLSDFGLPDILQLISIQQKTGLLELQSANDDASIRFQNGDIINVSCASRGDLTELLKRFLIQNDILPNEDIRQIESTARSSNLKFEKVLVTGRYVANDELEQYVSQIMEEIVYDLFTWKEASYSFNTDTNTLMPSFPTVIIRADGLLMEGMRRIDEWPEIERILPNTQVCFEKNTEIPTKPDELPPDEARIYTRISTQTSLQELLDNLGMGRYRTYEATANLLKAEVIVRVASTGKVKKEGPGFDFKNFFTIVFHNMFTFIVPMVILVAMGIVGYLYSEFAQSVETNDLAIRQLVINQEKMQLQEAIRMYSMLHNSFPVSLEVLVDELIISSSRKRDFEKLFRYEVTADGRSYSLLRRQ